MPKEEYHFWRPVLYDENGCYMTEGQLDFFRNGERGERLLYEYFCLKPGETNEFGEYMHMCQLYNAVNEILDEDPSAAELYWDEDLEMMMFLYSKGGAVSHRLRSIIKGRKP